MPHRWRPNTTVATVVEKDNRFLLVEEISRNKKVINQPAGHLEKDESFIEAAKRETLEETGWHVTPTALVGIYTYYSELNQTTYHRYCFVAKADKQEPRAQLDDGIIGPVWLSLDEIKQCDNLRSPMVITCVEDYLEHNHYPLDIIKEHT